MQVVLWKPQGHFVKDIIKDITNKNPDSVRHLRIWPQKQSRTKRKSALEVSNSRCTLHTYGTEFDPQTALLSPQVDMADIEMGSLRPDVADLVPAASPRRDGASTPVPDLLIEAAQMSHSNNAATAASREPDV